LGQQSKLLYFCRQVATLASAIAIPEDAPRIAAKFKKWRAKTFSDGQD
jgi:hypothetical protein